MKVLICSTLLVFVSMLSGCTGSSSEAQTIASVSNPAIITNSPHTTGTSTAISVSSATVASQSQSSTTTETSSSLTTSSSTTNSPEPSAILHFSVSASSAVSGGSTFQWTVTALDTSNNIYTPYSGTLHFTSTDAQATLPADVHLVNGTGSFSGSLMSAGSQRIIVTDTANTSATGTSNAINVSGASPLSVLDVLTYHNDVGRTGQYLNETTLTHTSVHSAAFGKLFSQSVDGQLFAQPLYKYQVSIPGKGVHNVVYAVTMHDSVYAFDADSNTGSNADPLWHRSFIDASSGVTSVPLSDYPSYHDIHVEIGVLSTPVIEASTGTLYCVAKTKETSAITTANPNGHVYRLHALDLATGEEKMGGPVVLRGSVLGTGDASVGGVITFDPYLENQRSALLLASGTIYISYASYGDSGPYHGWLMAYDAKTLAQLALWNDTSNGVQGGIWMNSSGPAWDGSSLYLSTGNGSFDADVSGGDYSDSIVKLILQGTQPGIDTALSVTDYFTPSNQASLNALDLDLDAGGVMLLPKQPGTAPNILIASGKNGTVYVVNRDNMGAFHTTDQIIQKAGMFPGTTDSPAYWNNFIFYKGSTVEIGQNSLSPLYAFELVPGTASTPTKVNFNAKSRSAESWGWPGATPSISANGTKGGIVWIIESTFILVGPSWTSTEAILRAYDATDLTNELYNSKTDPADAMGDGIKFVLPTIGNGKVFVGSGALNSTATAPSEISVFGLK